MSLVAVLCTASAASADGTVSFPSGGSQLVFTGSSGADSLNLSVSSGTYTLSAPAGQTSTLGDFAAGKGCSSSAANIVTCPDGSNQVNSIVLNMGGGIDTVNLRSNQDPTTVHGDADNDTITIGNSGSLDGILATVFVHGDTHVASSFGPFSTCGSLSFQPSVTTGDTLRIDDSGETTANTYSIATSTVQRTGSPQISYFTIEKLVVEAGSGNDTIGVASTVSGIASALTHTEILGGDGANAITVTTTGMNSYLRVAGGTGVDTITIQTTGQGSTTSVEADSGVDVIEVVTTGTNSNLDLNGGGGSNSFTIRGSGTGSQLLARGSSGDDTFFIGTAAGSVGGVLGNICVDGSSHAATPTTNLPVTCGFGSVTLPFAVGDLLQISDTADQADATYQLSATTFQRTGTGSIEFDGIERISIGSGGGADSLIVAGTPDSSHVTLDSGLTSAVTVQSTGASSILDTVAGSLTIQGSGAGSIVVFDGPSSANTVDVQFTGPGSGVLVETGSGADTINLRGSAPNSVVVLRGGDGNDTITVGSTTGSLGNIFGSTCASGEAHDSAPNVVGLCSGTNVILPRGDQITFDDRDGGGDNYSLTASSFSWDTKTITFDTFESLIVNVASGGPTISLEPGPSTYTRMTGSADGDDVTVTTGAGSIVVVDLGGGNDTLRVDATGVGSVTLVNGEAGDDAITVGDSITDLNVVQGPVCASGGSQVSTAQSSQSFSCGATTFQRAIPRGDRFVVRDWSGSPAARQFTVTATTIQRTGLPLHTFAEFEEVTLGGNAGNDTITVNGTPASALTTIEALQGNDQITVATTGTSSLLDVNAGDGSDTVTVQNTGSNSSVRVRGGNDGDTLTVQSSGQNSGVQLLGEAGVDALTVNGAGSGALISEDGGAGQDTLTVAPAASGAVCYNEQEGAFRFSAPTYSVGEAGGTATITVERGSSIGTAGVTFATSNGTATAGSDYTAVSTSISFANGESTKTVAIPVTPDALAEGAETVNLTLGSPTGGAVLGTPAAAVLTITDAAACDQGSKVAVQVSRAGANRLQVQLTATPTTTNPNNRLQSIHVLRTDNAEVDIEGQTGRQGDFTVPLPGQPSQLTFFVRRVPGASSAMVHATVRDGCGDWQTFFGGGPAAF